MGRDLGGEEEGRGRRRGGEDKGKRREREKRRGGGEEEGGEGEEGRGRKRRGGRERRNKRERRREKRKRRGEENLLQLHGCSDRLHEEMCPHCGTLCLGLHHDSTGTWLAPPSHHHTPYARVCSLPIREAIEVYSAVYN